jgi:hypothetical protein
MHARSLLLRRLAQRAVVVARPYHASLVSFDALDMVDTFARRHSKCAYHVKCLTLMTETY